MMRQFVGGIAPAGFGRMVWGCAVGWVISQATPAPGAGQTPGSRVGNEGESASHVSGAPPFLTLSRADGTIRVDGVLDDPAWQAARTVGDFVQMTPDEGQPATEPTDVRLLFDGDAVYVGVRLWDSDAGGIVARLGRRDTSLYSDWFYVFLDSYHDRRTAFGFGVNAAGVQRDVRYYDDVGTDQEWDAVWGSAVRQDAEGWTAEFRIPLSQLRFNATSEGSSWGINFERTLARDNQKSYWAPVPQNSNAFVSLFGTLSGTDGLSPPHRVEVLPYSSASLDARPGDAADPFYDPRATKGSAGADVRVGLGPSLTLSATVNPDFGQVEADPARINLSAFELYEQERRPFFVEGANIFRMNTASNFFYSRRIGRTPQGGMPSEAAYADRPSATTILSALKLTGKTAAGWSVGVLDAVTAAEKAPYVDVTGSRGEENVEPLTNYAVARVAREINQGRSGLGIMATTVNRRPSGDRFDFLHSGAYGLALDGFHRFGEGTYEVTGGFVGSHVRGDTLALQRTQRSPGHYFQRPDASHLTYDPTRRSLSGYSAGAQLQKIRGSWRGGLAASATSPGFEVNDLGFENGMDAIATQAWLQYQHLTPGRTLRSWIAQVNSNRRATFGGQRMDWVTNGSFNARFLNYWGFSVNAMRHIPSWEPSALRGGPSIRRPGLWMGGANVNSDSRRAFGGSLGFFWNLEDERDGHTFTYSGTLSARPSDRMDVSLSPQFSLGRTEWQYVGKRALGGVDTYLVGGLDQRMVSLSLRTNYTLSPTLSLELYARPYLAAGSYDAFREVVDPQALRFEDRFRTYGPAELRDDPAKPGSFLVDRNGDGTADFSLSDPSYNMMSFQLNSVLRWEFRPGSTLYAVWAQDRSGYGHDAFSLRRDLNRLRDTTPGNVLMVKVAYWLGM